MRWLWDPWEAYRVTHLPVTPAEIALLVALVLLIWGIKRRLP